MNTYFQSIRPPLPAAGFRKLLFGALLAVVAFAGSAFGQDHPNIVVILADDLGYGDVGFNGVKDIPTPNIDALAANGVICADAYVTAPMCAPSRAGLLTGRYQERYGYASGPNEDSSNPGQALPLTEITLPQVLKPAGYVSGAFGKWHLGFADQSVYPLQRGFDEFVGFLWGASNYYNCNLLRGNTPFFETDYLTDVFTNEAVSFIDNHASQPFFLYLAYNAVHDPYDVPPAEYMQRVSYITDPQRRIYAAMVVALDDGVGKVVQALSDNNVLDNTIIFFLSDNGAPLDPKFDGTVDSNLPLRGYKLDMLEGGIRVPFAVQWNNHIPAGTVSTDLVSSLDIFATAAAAAGAALPDDRIYDGLNILPYLSGEQTSPNRTLFWRWFGLGADGPLGAFNTIWAVRNGPYKLVVERAKDTLPPALYKLTTDIGETRDLSQKNSRTVASLQTLYNQWEVNSAPDLFEKDSDKYLLPLVLAGDWNGYDITHLIAPWSLKLTSAPNPQGTPDSYNWLATTIHVLDAGGDTTPGTHYFSVVANKDYSSQWGGVTVGIDTITTLPAQSAPGIGPLNNITFEDGYYYSVRVVDTNDQARPGANMAFSVMKTSAPPVTVSRTAQTPVNPTPTDPIVVSIATSAPPSPEERIYLRWSNDWFITSHIVEATGSGTSYSATIPPQPAGISVLYTVITSTADLNGYTASGVIDDLTLSLNGTFNAVPPVLPTITQQPADAKVNVGRKARFSVTATLPPLTYQWRKNGVAIVGAIAATYTTPPVLATDNGSQYSVIVSDDAGNVTSRDALLTVKSPKSKSN